MPYSWKYRCQYRRIKCRNSYIDIPENKPHKFSEEEPVSTIREDIQQRIKTWKNGQQMKNKSGHDPHYYLKKFTTVFECLTPQI